jgi:hypothetical protein
MMKTFYAIAASFLFTAAATAQLVEVRYSAGGAIVNGTTVHVNGHSGETSIDKTLYTTLLGSSNVNVNVKRYEINVQSGTKNTFCWGICPASVNAGTNPSWTCPVHIAMVPGVEYSAFKASHEPQGLTGTSTYRFVWFNTADPNDSVYVDIEYTVGFMSVADEPKIADLTVAQLNDGLSIKSNSTYDANEILVYDAIGNLVKRQRIERGSQTTVISMSSYESGIYFVTLAGNNARLVSRKVFYAAR